MKANWHELETNSVGLIYLYNQSIFTKERPSKTEVKGDGLVVVRALKWQT